LIIIPNNLKGDHIIVFKYPDYAIKTEKRNLNDTQTFCIKPMMLKVNKKEISGEKGGTISDGKLEIEFNQESFSKNGKSVEGKVTVCTRFIDSSDPN
jgi:hypothetical protein